MKISITLNDVLAAGGVDEALVEYCKDSDEVSCGVIGPSFATSGPGSGWSKQFGPCEYAERAMYDGALYYLDLDDGRLAESPDWTDDLYDGQAIVWSDDSVVDIQCPDIIDALQHPNAVAEMAKAVIDYHHDASDVGEWLELVRRIQEAATAFEDIRIRDLEALTE